VTPEHPSRPGLPRLVVDPGVWVSALIGKPGAPDELLEAAADGRLVVLISPLLLAELNEVLARDKFRRYFSVAEGEAFAAALVLLAQAVEDPPPDGRLQVCRDPDDDYLVALTEACEATLLVSGDKDLLAVQRPGLDVRSPRSAADAVGYRHPWGPALMPATDEAALAQAEAEGHGPVLATVSTFLQVLQERKATRMLAEVVTPESLSTWRRDLAQVRAMTGDRGMASRPEYPRAGVAYVKLPPDPGLTVRATGELLLPNAVIVTLQRRPELPGIQQFGGWRVHAIGDYVLPENLPQAPTG